MWVRIFQRTDIEYPIWPGCGPLIVGCVVLWVQDVRRSSEMHSHCFVRGYVVKVKKIRIVKFSRTKVQMVLKFLCMQKKSKFWRSGNSSARTRARRMLPNQFRNWSKHIKNQLQKEFQLLIPNSASWRKLENFGKGFKFKFCKMYSKIWIYRRSWYEYWGSAGRDLEIIQTRNFSLRFI